MDRTIGKDFEYNKYSKILISTQDVSGGVRVMRDIMGFLLKEHRYDVTFTFPARKFRDVISLSPIQKKNIRNILTLQIRSTPYIILLDQILASFTIIRMLKNYSIYLAIGGANLPAIPFMFGKKKYICWVATTIKDEDKLIFNPLHPFEYSTRIILYYFTYIMTPIIRWYEKGIYKKAAKIITISNHTAKAINREYNVPLDRISVIPVPVDTNKFKPLNSSKKDYILMVGRITDPRKNIRCLLESFARVKQNFPETGLHIIGKIPKYNRYIRLCKNLDILDSVSFLGYISEEEKIRQYNQAKLLVIPSLQEGLSIVVLESMACGTPVISTKCGGPEEIITHGINGILVENNDIEKLAEGICLLLSDEKMRHEMGIKAKEHICQNYSYNKIRPKLLKIISRYIQIYLADPKYRSDV